ncbi:MAG TPA: ATP-binding protein [Armatimonadota bacterium]|nr:ATP-binding protein [Armatimonadota bacterium]
MGSDIPSPSDPPGPAGSVEQRLADLAQFANAIVHDVRNPLNVIRTNLYLLRQRLGGEDARVVRSMDRIDDQVTVAMRLLESVQVLYRADTPALQRVQINEVVRQIVESKPPVEGCVLQVETTPDLPLISADPQLLEAAVRALLRNAVEATGAGAPVQLRTAHVGSSVQLVVGDSGPGVAGEVLGRAFEPLFTTRRGHAGIGLALVERVARAHGGSAALKPRPEGGTEAVLELPVGEAPAARS